MKTRKTTFTPSRLEAFRQQGRGTGTYADYQPFHQVRRGDPSSIGVSGIFNLPLVGRQVHLLSHQERIIAAFVTMVPGLVDLREQFSLPQRAAMPAISDYSAKIPHRDVPGTLDVARELGIRHPMTYEHGRAAPWQFSTDFLLTIRGARGSLSLFAVNAKATKHLSKRNRELFAIEQRFWEHQGVDCIQVKPGEYAEAVGEVVVQSMAWVQQPLLTPALAAPDCAIFNGLSYQAAYRKLASLHRLSDDVARQVFWRAVWSGGIPIDLATPLNTYSQLRLVPQSEFWDQNPITRRLQPC